MASKKATRNKDLPLSVTTRSQKSGEVALPSQKGFFTEVLLNHSGVRKTSRSQAET
jgi:hypothetical protein